MTAKVVSQVAPAYLAIVTIVELNTGLTYRLGVINQEKVPGTKNKFRPTYGNVLDNGFSGVTAALAYDASGRISNLDLGYLKATGVHRIYNAREK